MSHHQPSSLHIPAGAVQVHVHKVIMHTAHQQDYISQIKIGIYKRQLASDNEKTWEKMNTFETQKVN